MSQAHFIKAQVVGRPVSDRSAFVENVVALIVVTLALAVLMCLAAVAPAVWTSATAAVAESHIPVEPSQCLSIKDGPDRLACYDERARRPAKGTRETFGEVPRGRCGDHSNAPFLANGRPHPHCNQCAASGCRDAVCDVPANNRRNNWELTEWNDG
jgi:hypothetical protein